MDASTYSQRAHDETAKARGESAPTKDRPCGCPGPGIWFEAGGRRVMSPLNTHVGQGREFCCLVSLTGNYVNGKSRILA
jgi:hypothetical protein